MNEAFPAFQLLLVLSLTMIVGLPLLIWLFMHGHRDRGARWWFAAVGCNAVALLLVGWLQRFSAASAVLFLLALVLAIESMRWELQRPAMNRLVLSLGFVAYAMFQFALEAAGWRMSVGYPINLALLNLADVVLMMLLWQVSRRQQSRGLLMVAIGIALVLLPNVLRLLTAIAQGGGPEAFSGSPMTNVAIVLITIVAALQAVGYGGFVLEKLHQRQLEVKVSEARAMESRLLAERHAQELQAIIAQRDAMIVMNSRFSAVNSLAMLNSSIVHEISQPAQALTSILDLLSLKPLEPSVSQSLEQARQLVIRMGETLNALRRLMSSQEPGLHHLNLNNVVQEILPILHNEARRRGHTLTWSPMPDGRGLEVVANKVLLERITINLVTNAFEAMEGQRKSSPHEPGQVRLQTRISHEGTLPCAVLEVSDNGPGIQPEILEHLGMAFKTSKEQGVGLGLALARLIVETWRGQLRLTSPVDQEQKTGTAAALWIPLA